jgi:hypothetical protein
MKEKPTGRVSKAAREMATKELSELLPTIESRSAQHEEKQTIMKKSNDRARAERAATFTVERITKEIGDLQLSVSRMLTDLAQLLREESGKLADIRTVIETENARLKELHDIDASMVSLRGILEVAAERREALEAELTRRQAELDATIERKKEEWAREQVDHEARVRKTREREEEEYNYKLSLKRRKETDEYTAERAIADQEIQERESALTARESEIRDLQARVDRFPQELASATKQAEQTARSEAQKQAALDARLLKMETEAEKNVTALKIAGLEDLVKRQAAQLESLTKQLATTQAQIQAMAVKAIEGAAGMKTVSGQ